ncbi:unnamed protein product, partial [Brachionus calyciflorus]
MSLIQLKGFFKRNVKLRVRNKLQLVFEIYQQIIILSVLIIYNYAFVSEKLPSEKYNPESLRDSLLSKNLFIYPDNSQTRLLGNYLQFEIFSLKLKFFNDTKQMKEFYLNFNEKSVSYIETFGLEFTRFPTEYKIYHKYDEILFAGNKINYFADSRDCRNGTFTYSICAGNKIVYNGLAYLQYKLDASIKKFINPKLSYPKIKIQNMPKNSFVKEQTIFDGIKAYYFTLLYVYSLTTFVINIVAEKEKKIKELMKMMGLKDSIFWFSWISTYFLQFTALNLIISVL